MLRPSATLFLGRDNGKPSARLDSRRTLCHDCAPAAFIVQFPDEIIVAAIRECDFAHGSWKRLRTGQEYFAVDIWCLARMATFHYPFTFVAAAFDENGTALTDERPDFSACLSCVAATLVYEL